MRIVTESDCATAERVILKALSAVHARRRELRWLAELHKDSKYRRLTILAKIEAAEAKRVEELAEFKVLKAAAEWSNKTLTNRCGWNW